MEEQGCRVRKTKKGFMVYAPGGGTVTSHGSLGDHRAIKNDIANFRRIGLRHPEDTRPLDKETEMVERNEEGYPTYLTGPITSTTRTAVLSELESKGWPVMVHATELAMDTTSANKALYAIGYRWHDDDEGKKNRMWYAPDEIVDLHVKAKEEAERRAKESKEASRALRALPTPPPSSDPAIAAVRSIHEASFRNRGPIPTPEEIADAIEKSQGEKVAVPFEEKTDRQVVHEFMTEGAIVKPPKPEREFIDSVDSWVIEDTDLPPLMTVSDLRWTLEAAGLNVEVRVWRK
jgi:hypothetical protein